MKSCAKTKVRRPWIEAVAGDEAVAVDDLLIHAEIAAAVADELVHLFEGAFVEQQVDAFARGELAFLVLLVPALLAAPRLGDGMAASHFFQAVWGHIQVRIGDGLR